MKRKRNKHAAGTDKAGEARWQLNPQALVSAAAAREGRDAQCSDTGNQLATSRVYVQLSIGPDLPSLNMAYVNSLLHDRNLCDKIETKECRANDVSVHDAG